MVYFFAEERVDPQKSMKCLILAAGYATRLYPLTENFPKPLLTVEGKSILDHLLADIDSAACVKEYVVISNEKYYAHFQAWAKTTPYPVTVLSDGTTSNETRLGAVKDVQFAVERLGLDEDLLVIAGDNLLDFSLTKFIQYAKEKHASAVMRYYEPDYERLKKSGVCCVDETDLITQMAEKPENPQSHWCCPPFYYYKREDVPLVKKGIESGCKTDAPGAFIAWLSGKVKVYAMEMPGRRYDIGDIKSYEEVQKTYRGIIK